MPSLLKFTCIRINLLLLFCLIIVTPLFAIETGSSTIDRYRQALLADPDNPTLHYILALALLESGQTDDAVASFRVAYPAYTDSIEIHYNMGLAFSQSGDADSALLYLERAEELGALNNPEVFPLVNAYYNVGLIYLEKEALHESGEIFRRVLSLDPERVEIYRLLGDIAARSGRDEDAIQLFSSYLEYYPDDLSAREYLYALHFNRALKKMELGDNKSAREDFEAAGMITPDSPLVNYYLGSIAYNSGDASSAIRYLVPIYQTLPVELKESTRSILYNSVLRALKAQKFDLAIDGVAPLIQSQGPRNKDLMLAGSIYLQSQEYILAREMFNRVLENDPTHAEATINLSVAEKKAIEELFQQGLSAYKSGQFKEALDRFDDVLAIHSDDQRSVSYRKKTVDRLGSDASIQFKKGREALANKDYLQAVMMANNGLSMIPNDASGLRLKREALQALESEITQLLEHGFALLQRSDYPAAEAQFSKVLQIDPENKSAQKGASQSRQQRQTAALSEITKGNNALDDGRLEVAGKHFAQAESLVRGLPEAVEGRTRLDALITSLASQELQWGRRARSAGDLNQAEIHFKNALKLTDTPEIRRELTSISQARNEHFDELLTAARSARKNKDFSTARSLYNRLLVANPQHSAASERTSLNAEIAAALNSHLENARKKSSQGEYQAALNFYRQALDLEPRNVEALHGVQEGRKLIKSEISGYLQSGHKAFEQRDLAGASVAYKKVLQLDPYHTVAKAAMDSIAQLEQTGVRPGDENRLYLQGIELYTKGKYAEAIHIWQKVLQLDPDHTKAKMNIEKAQRKLQSIREFQSG